MNENSVRNLIAGLFVIFMLFVMIFIGFLTKRMQFMQ